MLPLVLSLLGATQSPPTRLDKCFGRSSEVLLAQVVNVSVTNRRGKALSPLPNRLDEKAVVQITLRPKRWLLSEGGDDDLVVRFSAPGESPGAFFAWILDTRLFLLKRNRWKLLGDFYYPADPNLFSIPESQEAEIQRLIQTRRLNTDPAEPGQDRISGRMFHVRMREGNDCWAATLAMMLSWRDQRIYTREAVAHLAGPRFVSFLQRDSGIEGAAKAVLIGAFSLKAESPQTFLPGALRDLLREHGPLWVTISLDDSNDGYVLPHARVVFAVDGDGTPKSTFLSYLDPNRAGVLRESVDDFTASYERVARADRRIRLAASQPFRAQIIHF